MQAKNLLMIFVKNPEPGKVKTRLAQSVGDDKAFEIYLKLMNHTMEQAIIANCLKEVWYSSFVDRNDLFDEKLFRKKVQSGSGLGEKMKHSFKAAFADGFEKVVIIGSDCPGISGELIDIAFEKLNRTDLVIGPAYDGGYYLLGMRQFIADVFDSIPWSTSSVFNKTIKIASSLSLSTTTLAVLRDIDTEDDLNMSVHSWLK